MRDEFIATAGAVYRQCNPLVPATADEYVDCAPARGNTHFARQVIGNLAYGGDPQCFLFAGQIGCGKSSELRRLAAELSAGPAGTIRYVPILVRALDYLDLFDARPEDVLLMLAAQLAEVLRVEYAVDLSESYLASRWRELLGLLGSDVHVEDMTVSADVPAPVATSSLVRSLAVKLRLIRNDPEAKRRLREALEPRHLSLRELIAQSVTVAENELFKKFHVGTKLVLIVDDLEKLEAFEKHSGRMEAQRQLFVERSGLLNNLSTVVIYSLSLDLARGEATRLQAAYGSAPFVLPTVKVFNRGRPDVSTTAGYECLQAIVEHRIRAALPGTKIGVADVFSEPALNVLIHYCGGDVRQLCTLVRFSLVSGEELPVGKDVALRAVGQLKATYSTTIAEAHWAKLAALDESPLCEIANHDPDYLKLLDQIVILEYVNGSGSSDQSPWYAVHPAVRELERFKLERSKSDQVP